MNTRDCPTLRIMAMVFNATLNNISVISWRSVLLMEETGVVEEKTTDLSQVTDKLYHYPTLNLNINYTYIGDHTLILHKDI